MRKQIISCMEKRNISQKSLSTEIGVSVGVINKFLSQKKEIGFDIVWKIARHLGFENRSEILSQYIGELTKKNIKYAMEYFSIHGKHEELSKLIDMANQGNAELKEWARIYSKLQEFQKRLYNIADPMNVVKRLRRLDTPHKELRMIIYLFEMYSLYYLNNYKVLHQYLLGIYEEVWEIEDTFLRLCFSCRVDELFCITELKYKRNPERARYYCDRLIDKSTENLSSSAHYIKAQSYIFEDLNRCVQHYKESIKYYERVNRQSVVNELKQEMELAYILWDKETDFTSDYTRTLYEVKNKLKSPDYLDEFINDEREPWIYYFKGIAQDDQIQLFSSLMKFCKKDDLFFANFPKLELIKMGIDEDVFKKF